MFKEIRDKLENISCSILHNSNNWPQVNGKKTDPGVEDCVLM